MDAQRIGFLGYGEVGQRFASDLRAGGAQRELAAFDLLLHQAAAGEGLAQKPFQLLLDLYRRNPLAWLKICGAERVSVGKRPFRDAVPFAQALIAIDAGRLLWGTDWPHPNISKDMPNDGELVDLLGEMCPNPSLRQRILVDNPTHMYWS